VKISRLSETVDLPRHLIAGTGMQLALLSYSEQATALSCRASYRLVHLVVWLRKNSNETQSCD
jgi:hypothetical protein